MLSTQLSVSDSHLGRADLHGPVEPCLIPPAQPGADPDWQADLTLQGPLAELAGAAGPLCAPELVALVQDGGVAGGGSSATLGALVPLIARTLPTQAEPGAALSAAVGLLPAGQIPQAAAEFLRALAEPGLRLAALQGLCATLVAAGQPREALALAEFLVAAGAGHPAVVAMAGWGASLTGDAALTRRYMARAARAARSRSHHGPILRFAQRTLLIQSFGA